MKRKILSLALIAALVFTLSVSAFATESPSGEDVLPTVSNGGTITSVSESIKMQANVAGDTATRGGIARALGVSSNDVDWGSRTVQVVFNYQGPSAAGQQVTFTNVPGVKQGQYVFAYHKWTEEDLTGARNWEALPAVATADGTVVVTFNGTASPIAIITISLTNGATTRPTTSSTVVTSPQTSDID